MLIGIMGIHHIGLSVPDLEKAREFYVGLLGMEEVWQWRWDKGAVAIDEMLRLHDSSAKVLQLRAGDFELELFEYGSPVPPPLDPARPVNNFGYTHFALRVSDAESVYQRLIAAGMDFHRAPIPSDVITATYGRDPFGNVIELYQIHQGSVRPHFAVDP